MSYTLPKTDKRFLRDYGARAQTFLHHHSCQNASYTHTITNPNAYSVEVVVSMQGGSGDTTYQEWTDNKEYYWGNWAGYNEYSKWRYSYAGRVGNTLTLSFGGRVLAVAGGGAGTPQYKIAEYQGYRYKKSGDKHSHTIRDWTYNHLRYLDCRQEGEQVACILTLRPHQSATIHVQHNGAGNAPTRGSYTISGYV